MNAGEPSPVETVQRFFFSRGKMKSVLKTQSERENSKEC